MKLVLIQVICLVLTATMRLNAYDLGGPCKPEISLEARLRTGEERAKSWADRQSRYEAAEKAKRWDEAIDIAKFDLRENCKSQSEWDRLANILLRAGRNREALDVLIEMQARGFDPNGFGNTSEDGRELERFLESEEFQASPPGKIVANQRAAREARRQSFRRRLQALAPDERPSSPFVLKDICPFECCSYGSWKVIRNVNLFDRPNGRKIIADLKRGEQVKAVAGELHSIPCPMEVVESDPENPDLKIGDIVYYLSSLGEGFAKFWHKGEIVTSQDGFMDRYDDCVEDVPTWWVQIRSPKGVLGWTKEADSFDGLDKCR